MSKTQLKTEEDLTKEILAGKYKDYYLIYNRKSTDEAENQKNSIEFQKVDNIKYAERAGLRIAPITIQSFCTNGVISEKHSGFKESGDLLFSGGNQVQYSIDRPKFFKLLDLLNRGLFKGVVCFCWDRISRNKGDDTIVRKLISRGTDIRFTHASYDKSSSGALHMDIDGMFAEHHSRVTSEKVRIATWNLREKGVCTYKAPIGYLNNGTMEFKPHDPERAPVIKAMFNMYAQGDKSLSDLARFATEQGLTTAPIRPRRSREEILGEDGDENQQEKAEKVSYPITANHVQRILSNNFYIGYLIGKNGSYIKSVSHKPLVDEDIFYKVQNALKKKNVSIYYSKKISYPFRGIAHCSECGRVYTPYIKKGIQYYGVRCDKSCINTKKSFNLDYIENEVGKILSTLYFTDEELQQLDSRTRTDVSVFEDKRLREIENLDRQKKKIREDLTYLRTNKISLLSSSVYSMDEFVQEENRLSKELTILQDSEQVSDMAMHEVVTDIIKLSELLKNTHAYYSFANTEEKEQIIRIIFSELLISNNTFTYQCKNGFKPFQSRFHSVCGQGGTRTLNP